MSNRRHALAIWEEDFPRKGQALERVLLAALAGYSTSCLNQPVEVPALRSRLRALAASDTWSQIMLRIGRGRAVPPAPRRPLSEVLV